MLTIVLTGGGSGGHITPLLPLARALKKKDSKCRIVYIGLKGDKLEGLQGRYTVFDQVYTVPAGKFRRYHGQSNLARLTDLKSLFLNTRDLFRVIRGIFSARRLLRRIKPDIVFSKGGYVAVPVGIAAHMAGIPIITHDSDAVPGLANRFIGRWAVVHATGMPAEHYSYPKDSIRYTGIPVDERIKPVNTHEQAEFKKALGIQPESLVLLVGGAGHGAQTVNNLVCQISPDLFSHFPNLHILHISGPAHLKEVQEQYSSALAQADLKKVTAIGFTPDFYSYTGAADLIITRAGASTLAELALQRKAVLLIPAPFLTGGHQLENAKALAKAQAVEVLNNDVEPKKLLATVSGLLENKQRREKLALKLASTAHPDAAKELAAIILEIPAGGAAK